MSASAAAAAATITARQKRYIDVFREAGATRPDRAVTLAELDQKESWIFRRMAAAGVFIAGAPGCYFLDVEAGQDFIVRRRRRALEMLKLLLLLLAAAGAMSWVFRQ